MSIVYISLQLILVYALLAFFSYRLFKNLTTNKKKIKKSKVTGTTSYVDDRGEVHNLDFERESRHNLLK